MNILDIINYDFSVANSTLKKLELGKANIQELNKKNYNNLNYYLVDHFYELPIRTQGNISLYTSDSGIYEYLNALPKKKLLGNRKIIESRDLDYDYYKKNYGLIRDIDKSLKELFSNPVPIKHTYKVYRYIHKSDPILSLKPGDTGRFKGYISCSIDKFCKVIPKNYELIEIILPRGFMNAVTLGDHISMFSTEREVLINKGTYYKVIQPKVLLVNDKEFD